MLISICIGLWGWLYGSKLVHEGEVFSFMPNVSEWLAGLGENNGLDPVQNPNYIQNAIIKWGYKCGTCHAGIVALFIFSKQFWFGHIGLGLAFSYLVLSMVIAEITQLIQDRYL